MLQRLTAAAALLGALGCVEQTGVDTSVNAIVVHAVIDAAAPDQYVIVQRTSGSTTFEALVKGAVITLTLPDGTLLTAAETADTVAAATPYTQPLITPVYRFAFRQLGIALVPGGTYRLRVVTPDGQVVTGSTTLPAAAPDTTSGPSSTFNRLSDTLSLTWPRVGGARSYEVHVGKPAGNRTEFNDFTVFTDTAVVLGGMVRSADNNAAAFLVGATQRVVVYAVDGNYYDYYRRGSDFFSASGLISHLNGGLGLFGSMVQLSSRTVVVR